MYNAANEVLVEAFHAGRVTFPQISAGIAAALDALTGDAPAAAGVLTVDSVLAADSRARDHTRDWIAQTGAEQMRTVR
ncbi:hypothetical protein NLM24_48925 [Nocardia zapadnayensis]|nr:hypothetical protein [Nocardia zapadnayensis]MCX0278318.1 hypothetical protein [Nocardia zapadnayensis]